MKRLLLILLVSLLLSANISCQSIQKGFPVLKGTYLGQTPPGPTPKVFAPGIISTEKGWEAAISFSPDLRELFFTSRSTVDGTENRVMYMKMVNNIWTEPKLAPFAKEIMEYEAFITPDNKKVIYKSKREIPDNTKGGIWYSQRENNTWSEAKYLHGPINKGWAMSVTSTLQGTLYFTGIYGIYRSKFINGEYMPPELLPKEINKSKYFGAAHPYIAPDESYLIFDASVAANSELFISFKKEDGNWTEAVMFDKIINTQDHENIATVSPDGKYLFFSKNNDVYWVDAKIISELKQKETLNSKKN